MLGILHLLQVSLYRSRPRRIIASVFPTKCVLYQWNGFVGWPLHIFIRRCLDSEIWLLLCAFVVPSNLVATSNHSLCVILGLHHACCEELISVSLGSSVSTKEQLYIALIEGRHRPHEGLTLF